MNLIYVVFHSAAMKHPLWNIRWQYENCDVIKEFTRSLRFEVSTLRTWQSDNIYLTVAFKIFSKNQSDIFCITFQVFWTLESCQIDSYIG